MKKEKAGGKMSKKILVIEDWEDFIKAQYPSDRRLLEGVVRDYELDVIGFEAGISDRFLVLLNDLMKFYMNLGANETLQVFVVKPKKPEVK